MGEHLGLSVFQDLTPDDVRAMVLPRNGGRDRASVDFGRDVQLTGERATVCAALDEAQRQLIRPPSRQQWERWLVSFDRARDQQYGVKNSARIATSIEFGFEVR